MRSILVRCIGACALVLVATPALAQQLDLPRPSPGASVKQTVGVTDISVDYSSPAVKGRKIWGGVVKWDEVWRAGANAATKITFSKDVTIGDKPVPAGSYSFFVVPTPTKWTLILNKEAIQFGAFAYHKDQDYMRVEVKAQPSPHRERLAYLITNFSDNAASIDLEWEKMKVSLPVKLHTDEQVAATVKQLQQNGGGLWTTAARYELDKKNYDLGLTLVDQSIAITPTWLNTFVKAQLLAGKGNFKDAYPLAQKAKEMGDKAGDGFFLKEDVENALKAWKGKI